MALVSEVWLQAVRSAPGSRIRGMAMELVGSVLSVVAFAIAWMARRDVEELRRRFEQRRTASEPRAREAVGRRDREPARSRAEVPAALPAPASVLALAAPPPARPAGYAVGQLAAPAAALEQSAERARVCPRGPDLEGRVGARWSVWAGGVALALSGAYLVKYSVESGFLSPPVRRGFQGPFLDSGRPSHANGGAP